MKCRQNDDGIYIYVFDQMGIFNLFSDMLALDTLFDYHSIATWTGSTSS